MDGHAEVVELEQSVEQVARVSRAAGTPYPAPGRFHLPARGKPDLG